MEDVKIIKPFNDFNFTIQDKGLKLHVFLHTMTFFLESNTATAIGLGVGAGVIVLALMCIVLIGGIVLIVKKKTSKYVRRRISVIPLNSTI